MTSIHLAPEARERLLEELEGRILRISFTTGCGGSGYRLASVEEPLERDELIDLDGIRVAMDEMATSNLSGARIILDEDEGFTLDHPSAAVASWCG
ncbi:MAG: iron-sulfur cluster insertion protein ErpA [Thermoanaerobaculia bacterium]|nr:iron-sulfur cluster insertion protein ErpA [Thermoanaerobaculia bacterium]